MIKVGLQEAHRIVVNQVPIGDVHLHPIMIEDDAVIGANPQTGAIVATVTRGIEGHPQTVEAPQAYPVSKVFLEEVIPIGHLQGERIVRWMSEAGTQVLAHVRGLNPR